ncbi:hypothetical protein BLEM_1431 [Bifidobacterium lemurum]|uniref:DUF3073 domain-containing protein n=1 Tax=Bifidobacterium lemurum TaxID=1603886 RepID=A0A261FRA3_9BIFI|nr:DUF3073 domain-containing protein [Bifidobacterium lemurum]OZG61483.1 hypothetical protein BLEM_1431 [Bifidobacterium lemurum]QOL35095.1 DUF3073 domain-containing protein [Bifidobacterium lemurum]
MGRGRQKAKQQKIARKLKYLTTDTDYDELAKELSEQEPGTGSTDPFADVADIDDIAGVADPYADVAADGPAAAVADPVESAPEAPVAVGDDLDEYAKWAAEAAAKATSGEMPEVKAKAVPKPRPIPMPMPSALKAKK